MDGLGTDHDECFSVRFECFECLAEGVLCQPYPSGDMQPPVLVFHHVEEVLTL